MIVKDPVSPSSTFNEDGVIDPPAPADAVTVKVGMVVKFASTVQFELISPVVYVAPSKLPDGQSPPTLLTKKPASAVSVNCANEPGSTCCDTGEIEPPADAVPETVTAVRAIKPDNP